MGRGDAKNKQKGNNKGAEGGEGKRAPSANADNATPALKNPFANLLCDLSPFNLPQMRDAEAKYYARIESSKSAPADEAPAAKKGGGSASEEESAKPGLNLEKEFYHPGFGPDFGPIQAPSKNPRRAQRGPVNKVWLKVMGSVQSNSRSTVSSRSRFSIVYRPSPSFPFTAYLHLSDTKKTRQIGVHH